MATRKTWIWILVGGLGGCVVLLIVVASVGAYFVAKHIQTEQVTNTQALHSFDTVKATFKERGPVYQLDAADRPRIARPFGGIPTSAVRPSHLWILAWNPEEERVIRVSLPFWMARFGSKKFQINNAGRGFDLNHLDLDVDELERIGPALVFDFRDRDGARVLVWTQ